jgi:hypothetical protein
LNLLLLSAFALRLSQRTLRLCVEHTQDFAANAPSRSLIESTLKQEFKAQASEINNGVAGSDPDIPIFPFGTDEGMRRPNSDVPSRAVPTVRRP